MWDVLWRPSNITVDVIISSPLRRATQTAAVVANEIDHEDKVIIDNALRPGASYEQFQELLRRYSRKDAIMVVGHNPTMTEFLNKLIGRHAALGGSEEGLDRASGKGRPQGRCPEVVHAAEGGALDSAGFGQQFAAEDGLEVVFLLLDGPQFQIDSFRGFRLQQQTHAAVLVNADLQLGDGGAAALVQRARQAQQGDGFGNVDLLDSGQRRA